VFRGLYYITPQSALKILVLTEFLKVRKTVSSPAGSNWSTCSAWGEDLLEKEISTRPILLRNKSTYRTRTWMQTVVEKCGKRYEIPLENLK